MEVALGLGAVWQAAAVAQLIGIAARLIAKIIGAVKTAQLNKLECEQLGRQLSTIRGVLSTLPEDLEAEPPLKELNYTLQEADNMVVACQNRNAARQFFGARHHADCFRQVNDSFGVVILEALTGRPPVSGSWEKSEEAVTLVDSALPAMKIENLRHVLDGLPSLKPTPQQLKALELVAHTARCCLWPDGKDRPAMSNVVADLETALGIIRSNEPKLLCY